MIGLMQPVAFPPMSYFEFISKVDRFYFLDDVQLSKQSFQTRNRILIQDKNYWITIPIEKISLKQKISETKIIYNNWYKKVENTVKQNYSKSPYLNDFFEIFTEVLDENHIFLSDFNISLTNKFITKLKIKTLVYKTSDFETHHNKIKRIVSVMNINSETKYLTVPGSLNYIQNSGLLNNGNLKIYKFVYKPMSFDTYQNRISIIHYLLKFGFKKLSEELGEYSETELFNSVDGA